MSKPVLLLAFANEQGDGGAYLRNLPRELNRLKAVAGQAEEAGLCEVEILPNATLSQIFDAFQKPKYRGRIALFHFGGHAGSFQLLLENEAGASAQAHGGGLLPFLAAQESLRLIFLNGCFSIRQAQELVDRGIPAVVGTVQAVEDSLATGLASRFYQALAYGNTLERSWEEATYYLKAERGAGGLSAYYHKDQQEKATRAVNFEEGESRFPWEILYRPGAEAVRNWNLPEASGNLLFGLPELPGTYLLPNEPFHFLKRYTQAEAPVFFGRGREIRDLFQRITNPLSSPAILLYGQSGVGKSSLLEAGLLPRLEKSCHCIYFRRDPEMGLPAQLEGALGVKGKGEKPDQDALLAGKRLEKDIQQLEAILGQLEGDARRQVEHNIQTSKAQLAALHEEPLAPDLLECWKKLEEEKPLLLIIDQLEEVFTRPNKLIPDELESFLRQVQAIFGLPAQRPEGKLVLSYRQEYHAELDKAMSDFNIYREENPLFRLDKKGIMEVVGGISSTLQLRNKYNVGVEPELPALIADDLLEDRHSPIAPVLQIILTKLWQKQSGEPLKAFRQDDYQLLKREGILLQDFFDQQMAAIRAWEQEIHAQVESSGLALDILNFHVTSLVTAGSRELDTLRRLYEHRADVLERLIEKFQSLYLLAGVSGGKTRLAHDTLAPIVQKKMKTSDYPGQRALRILESKASDYLLAPHATYIDEEDLKLVETGAGGMRIWMPKERELVEKSRERRAALMAERRRNRLFRMAAVAAIALLAVVATVFWRLSEKGKRVAEANALYNEGRLIAVSNPTEGLALIRAAMEANPGDSAKRRAYYELYAQDMFYEVLFRESEGFLNRAAVSPDGQYLAAAVDANHEIRVYDLKNGALLNSLKGPNSPVYSLRFVGNAEVLAGSEDRNAYLWQLPSASRISFEPPAGMKSASVRSLALSADKQWICTGHAANYARLWAAKSGQMVREFQTESKVQAVAFHPDGRQLFLGVEDGGLYRFSLEGELLQLLKGTGSPVTALAIGPDGLSVLAGHENGWLCRWQWGAELERPDSTKAHEGEITALAFSPDGGYWLSASRDRLAKVWEAASGRALYTLKGHTAPVHSLSMAEDMSAVFTAAEDSTVRRWAFPFPLPWKTLETGGFYLNDICWAPNGQHVLAASADRKVYVWDAGNYGPPLAYEGHRAGLQSLAVSPDGKWAASGDAKGEVHIWALGSGEMLCKAQLHEAAANSLSFSNQENRQWLASAGDDHQVVVWKWGQDGLDTARLSGHRYEASSVCWSPDGRQLMSTGLDSLALLWEADSWKLLDAFQLGAAALSARPAAKEKEWLVLAADGWMTRFLNGKPTARLPGHAGFEWENTRGFYLALGNQGCAPGLYSGEGFPMQAFTIPYYFGDCEATSLALSPGGGYIAIGTDAGKVLIWNNRRMLEARLEALVE